MQNTGTASGGQRSTGSRRRRKRFWRFANDPADKVHRRPGEGRRSGTHGIIGRDARWINFGLTLD
jgi:hypothetical protein